MSSLKICLLIVGIIYVVMGAFNPELPMQAVGALLIIAGRVS